MRRLLVLLVGILAIWLGAATAAAAMPTNLELVHAYTYDDPKRVVQIAGVATATTDVPLGVVAGVPSSIASRHVAANAGASLIGKSYGLGTVVEKPGLAVKGFQGAKTPGHALNRVINRGVSPSMLRNTVANPKAVLRQGSGNYLHLSDEAVLVLGQTARLSLPTVEAISDGTSSTFSQTRGERHDRPPAEAMVARSAQRVHGDPLSLRPTRHGLDSWCAGR